MIRAGVCAAMTAVLFSSALMGRCVTRTSAAEGNPPVQRRIFTYKKAAKCDLKADVYRAPGDAVQPAIIWLHGGALIWGSREEINPEQLRLYLDAGFTVIAIDYRLAPESKLDSIIEDLRDAYKWVRSEGPQLRIDPDRIAFVGHSAGGYLTLLAGCKLKPAPRALVSFYGYGDIAGDWYNHPDPYYSKQPAVPKDDAMKLVGTTVISNDNSFKRFPFYLYCRQQGLWTTEVLSPESAKNPEVLNRYSPIRNIGKNFPATLLIHGDKDNDVPHEQSVLMANELKRHSIDCEMISVPGRGHVFDITGEAMKDPATRAIFEKAVSFLKQKAAR